MSAGANVKAVQAMLGHASTAMTLDVHSVLFDADLDGVADRIDSLPDVSKMHDATVTELPVAFVELDAGVPIRHRNIASRALLERLGVRQEAPLIENEWFKSELTSEADYAVLAREWLKARR